jgi:putative endonuclease
VPVVKAHSFRLMRPLPWVRRGLLSDRRRLGRWGQRQAERHLRRQGCRTLARNWSASCGELDLVVCETDGTLVFVEVKTRRSEDFAPAGAAVNFRKQRRIARTAKRFVTQYHVSDSPLRFDVITVILPPRGAPHITHYPAAFVP